MADQKQALSNTEGQSSAQSTEPSVSPNPQPPARSPSPAPSGSESDDFEYAAEDFEERFASAHDHAEDGNRHHDDGDDDDDDYDHHGSHEGGYWCHQCHAEISPLMDSGTPTCPLCASDFVEEIEEESDPRQFAPDDDDDEHDDDHHRFDPADFVFFDHPHDANGTGGGAVLHGGAFGVQLDDSGIGVAGGPPPDVARLLQGWLQQVLGNAGNRRRPSTIHTPAGEEGHAPAAEVPGETAGAHAAAAEDDDDGDAGRRRPSAAAGASGGPTRAPAGNIFMTGTFPGTGPGGAPTFTVRNTMGADGAGPPVLDLATVLQGLLGMGDQGGQDGANPLHALFNMVGNPGGMGTHEPYVSTVVILHLQPSFQITCLGSAD
ncbi:hypothetical protein HDU86_000433 [Geranomyces michiganensis]|nr:hypothetical protein HDU86_000433 [Geranomyces michiganensis]